jgi:hypothetical protein
MVVSQVFDGVGITDEPPGVSLGKDPEYVESFGTYLSKVLYWALEECGHGNWHQFLDAAATALQVAGIDPMEPHLHSRRLEIEELDRRGRIAQSRGLSLLPEAEGIDWAPSDDDDASEEAEVFEGVYQAGMRAHLRGVRTRTRRPALDAATDPGSATDAATHPVI